jgi:Zn-dependent protease with chaperone function
VLAFDIFIAMPLTALFLLRVYGSGTAEEVGAAFWGIIIPLSIAYGAVASLWAAFTLLRSEKWLLAKLDATLIPTGTEIETKMALKDMAIAAGLPVAPALYLIDTRSTNAFVFAARRRRAVIGITRGFLTKLTLGERRAVFANLVARLKSGDTITSTGITALMWPVHAWRTSRQDSDNRAIDRGIQTGGDDASEAAYVSNDAAEGMMVLLVFGAGFAILSELVAAGHRRSQLSTAEKADAEGMLLLKDPTSMLSALTHCVELDNLVPSAGEAFSELFYCWTGVATNDETDPEWERVARLREVLGVEGIAWGDRADVRVPEGSFAPPAPRLSVPPPNETNRLN